MTLAAAYYSTNQARSAFYPQLTLSGSAGWTNSLGQAVSNPAGVLINAVAQLAQPIFNKGQLRANLRVSKAEEEIARLKDRYLRQAAEFDNFRKRTLKEKSQLLLNGGEKVITSLLPVLDDLERAMDNMEKSTDVATLREGVELIVSKLQKTLATHGLKKIETEGKDFDTDFHEAVALVPADEEAKKNKIIDCVQPGYMLNEKVIRHSKVVVGQ